MVSNPIKTSKWEIISKNNYECYLMAPLLQALKCDEAMCRLWRRHRPGSSFVSSERTGNFKSITVSAACQLRQINGPTFGSRTSKQSESLYKRNSTHFIIIIIIIIIVIIIIYCNWVVTRWQWLFYMYTKYEIGY